MRPSLDNRAGVESALRDDLDRRARSARADVDELLAERGSTGIVLLDFGAFPGAPDASVDVTDQASIAADAVVRAWIEPTATADHSADEHVADPPRVVAGSIVPGVGFTVYGVAPNEYRAPDEKAPRMFGAWTVRWQWSPA